MIKTYIAMHTKPVPIYKKMQVMKEVSALNQQRFQKLLINGLGIDNRHQYNS